MLAGVVAEAAIRFEDHPALVAASGWSLSYKDLDRASSEVAVGLTEKGIQAGDVVALVLEPCPEHIVLYIAAAKIGAVTAAVNTRLTASERDSVLAAASPRLVVATEMSASGSQGKTPPREAFGGVAPRSPTAVSTALTCNRKEPGSPSARLRGRCELVVISPASCAKDMLGELRVAGGVPLRLDPDPSRPVAIVFTSGTTGIPKGALFCESQISFITACDVGRAWGGGGSMLAGTSLAHLGPMTKLEGNLRRGTTSYLMDSWHASEALRLTSELGLTTVAGVPSQIALMLSVQDFDAYDLSSVRAVVMGGGPATPALVRQARERFGAPVAVRYSCTEAGIGTGTSLDDPPEDAELSVGRPLPGVRLTIVSEEGEPVPTGEVGEVCLGSQAVMSRYWNHTDGDGGVLRGDGSVRTGDLGRIDLKGRLVLVGRATERYVRGGYNVYPMEVESVLAEHPAIQAVAVAGRPDEVMGEVGVAVVVARSGQSPPSLEEIHRFARDRLAAYKLPAEVMTVPALPLTAMEKLDRRALAQMVSRSAT